MNRKEYIFVNKLTKENHNFSNAGEKVRTIFFKVVLWYFL